MFDEMRDRMAEKEQRRNRLRSIVLLSLILHMAIAIVYIFVPLSRVADQPNDSMAFDLFEEPDQLLERRIRPKTPLTQQRLDPTQRLARDAEQKKINSAKNERAEVVKLSEKIVLHDVETNKAPIDDILPDVMTDAKLREAEASNLSRLLSQPGETDGRGDVTGRVRARGDGTGIYHGLGQDGGGGGLVEGGGRPGGNDPLGMGRFLNSLDGPQDVVFCLDISASMQAAGLNKLDLALNSLKDTVMMLGTDDRFNIVPFSSTARLMSEKLLEANETNISRALMYLDTFTPERIQNNVGTNILAALDKAIKQNSTAIVLVTDGLPTTMKGHKIETDPEKILEFVSKHNVNKARIFVVALEIDLQRSPGAYLLSSLAHQSKGDIKVVGSEKVDELNQ
ncbi:VWA domain-containing protein [Candidatus Poribacteria bacterium]|nr:VWA domain-containing protein [Candidatus Poribacteria bacterium]MYB66716.1 VWA domain-containing protein [Candidatus Poribacteria bacterium]MYF56004.1 VWA domain-containing protein [Candidatus Poribacteria bacterium]MYI94552.1 VWA domain-containing protein [Candidatus Poribacteria bacterium]